MPGVCSFNDIWLEQEKYKKWLQKDKSCKRKAFCTLCKKTINLASMGEGALTSHAKGWKHQQNKISAKQVAPVSAYFSQPAADGMTSTKQPTKSALATSTLKTSLNTFCTKSEVLRSEVLWTMKCIHSHYSMNSCKGINSFKAMFPDSKIAEQFSCSERKTAYLGVFGIAPFFADQLLMKVREANLYVLSV